MCACDQIPPLLLICAACAGAGGGWRGYNVAPAKGLQLFEIDYPAAVDDPHTLLYPHLEHDEFGRLTSLIPGASSVDEE